MGNDRISFYSRVVAHTEASSDQDHLRVIIDSNPGIPVRTAAIPGADFVVIPSVSAHAFIEELEEKARLPVLSVLDAVVDEIRQDPRGITHEGLPATTGTVRAAGRRPVALAPFETRRDP